MVIEGLLSALAGQITWLESVVGYFLRANAYSLVVESGVRVQALTDNGPGSFTGPFVSAEQAIAVLVAYTVCFLSLAAFMIRRRDVS